MNPIDSRSWLTSAIVLTLGFFAMPTQAQIIPDATLPNNSIVLPNGNIFTIDGGTEAGTNLFHSFEEFSLPTGNEAFFDNALTIDNIITRVTGRNLSDIDGLIRANGTANLFLINPNGIQFGPNARLDIGGSFLGSTAESLLFEDGSFYSATEPNTSPLLTVNVPIGLQMGQNPAAIQVRGTGHNLAFIETSRNTFPPFTREANPSALTVQSGRTLALIGGDVFLEGGQLLAPKGRIEVGSVDSGRVSIAETESGFALDYEGAVNFRDIQLSQQAAVDASGAGEGGIYLTGRQISLLDGSVALIQNQESTPAGTIEAIASESLELMGTTPDGTIRSSLNTETDFDAAGDSANIQISTGRLLLDDGGQLISRTYGTGKAGNISVDASDSIEIIGTAPLNSRFFSSIFAIGSAGSFGNSGDVTISTGQLTILDGGIISAGAFGNGAAGSVTVRASESVELIGSDPIFESPSDINVGSFRSGNAGNLTIDSQRLVVRDGARVRASTIGNGNAGSITVNASQLVEVSGQSTIESSANFPSTINRVLGTSEGDSNPSGQAGGITVNAERLVVRDGGEVTVRNIGEANGGKLQVSANSILLDGEGSLSASTASGEGGNLSLDVSDLQLRNGSTLSAEAGGIGKGGNVTLETDTIALLEDSRINANAFEGAGGNIEISTSGLFVSPDSQITASSQFGVDGLVSVNSPVTEPSSGLVTLSSQPLNPNTQIQNSCEIALSNRFSITGNGGLPAGLAQPPSGQTVWRDIRLGEINSNFASNSVEAEVEVEVEAESPTPEMPLVEATGWRTNTRGQVELVAASSNSSHSSWQPHPECDRTVREPFRTNSVGDRS
ncbi:MAG: S-layer family protein [Cyanobacteriota bacterium]|nr:S-layer family protein [Cyanobacteriota bacterium]